jgi:transcriptional regulator
LFAGGGPRHWLPRSILTSMKLNRRQVLAYVAAGGCGLQKPGQAEISPSLYVPKAHLIEDRKLLHDFMERHRFVELITCSPTLRITHIPVILDRAAGVYGSILGHVSRQNPQSRTFDGSHAAVAVFRGPHGYISPTWFANKDVVPTWNFAVVHAAGRPRAIADKRALHEMLARLIDSFEKYQESGYDFSKLPESYVSSLMDGLVGFEMSLESLEGKFKLGQSWSEQDRRSALEHLRQPAWHEPSLGDISADFYRRSNPG